MCKPQYFHSCFSSPLVLFQDIANILVQNKNAVSFESVLNWFFRFKGKCLYFFWFEQFFHYGLSIVQTQNGRLLENEIRSKRFRRNFGNLKLFKPEVNFSDKADMLCVSTSFFI